MKKIILTLALFVGLSTMAVAQFSQFHAGLAFPSGKFADGDYGSDILFKGKGMAAMGFTLGYKHYSPLAVENLTWVFGIEAFYNGLNSDAKDDLEDSDFDDTTFPMYFNFPVTFGLNYAFPLQETLKFYGEVAVGGNLSLPTSLKYSDSDYYQDYSYKFTPAVGLAYALEGGLFINDKYSVGLRYNNLGSYKYKYEIDYEEKETQDEKLSKSLPILNMSLCLGVLF
ncbi:MAG: porin family protein [Tannerellaceae bacterium]|jgi:hypothetical protein|nr:porin family protein [Tannerellaceae bacterium]